jgi:hypothetical protein
MPEKPDPVEQKVREMTKEVITAMRKRLGEPLERFDMGAFRDAFRGAAHSRDIFHGTTRETYNFFFRRVMSEVKRQIALTKKHLARVPKVQLVLA